MPDLSPEASKVVLTENISSLKPPVGSIEADIIAESRKAILSEEPDPLATIAGVDILSEKSASKIHRKKLSNSAERASADSEYKMLSEIVRGENLSVHAGKPEIVSIFDSYLSTYPTLHSLYEAMRPSEQQEFRLSYLSDSSVRSEIVKALTEKVSIDKLEDDKVSEKTKNRDRLTEERQKLEAEREALVTARTEAENNSKAFESSIDLSGNVSEGEYLTKINQAEVDISTTTANIDQIKEGIARANQRIETLTKSNATLRSNKHSHDVVIDDRNKADIDELNRFIENETLELKDQQNKLAKATKIKTSLEATRSNLKETITKATERIREIDKRLNGNEDSEGLIEELNNATVELTNAINEKAKGETYINELKGILKKSIGTVLEKNIKRNIVAEESVLDERSKNAKTELERNLIESMKNRYINGEITNWANFEIDWPRFMNEGVNPIIDSLLPAGTTAVQLSTTNPVEYKKISEEITKQLLRLRMRQPREGGRLARLLGPKPISEADILVTTTRIGDEGFKTALAENKALRDLISAADKDKLLNIDGKITEGIKKLPMGKILLILAALLGIGIFKGAGS